MKPAQKLNIPNDRMERLHYVRRTFPNAIGDDLANGWAGGRSKALGKLNNVDALAYGRNRNFLNGSVTHLSPYLRHGCLTLSETFAAIKSKFGLTAENLLMQLAWRDYWRQVWSTRGNAIYSEMEPPKVALGYAPLTEAVRQGKTGLPCMDAFIDDLLSTGYVHNHARMWLASYIVHHLKLDWREAADWFEAHLLDGDIASNHLSWQWVASTFSSKPYYFNKENLARYTGEKYCAGCTAHCPFDASYETLQARLFTQPASADAKRYPLHQVPMKTASMHKAVAVYVHDEMLSPNNSVLSQPFPKIFVFDPQLYADWPLNRLQFVMDCLSEMMNVEVWVGGTYDVLMQRNVGELITQATPNLKIREMLSPFSTKWQPLDKLVDVEMSDKRLQRFSRYWDKAGPLLLNT
jgi:deoxyribodipyrimidine photo-lyase